MRKPIVILFCSLIALLFLTHCSDEEGEKKASTPGTWNIDQLEYTIVDQLINPSQTTLIGTATNAGAITLESGGTGSFNIDVEGYSLEETFAWTESETGINITKTSQSINGFNITQIVVALTGDKPENNAMTLSGSYTKQQTTSQFVLTADMVLSK